MDVLMLVLFLVVNTAISSWNAYAAGSYLTESKIIGGWTRFVTWCALVMSACGFTWVYLTLVTLGAIGGGWLTARQGQVLFELGYLVLILPILGSGFGLWANSLVEAHRQRTLGSVGVGVWNTYAQFHNTWQAASDAPGFFSDVMGFFSSDDDNDDNSASAGLILLLVLLALAGGIITTTVIAQWADRRVAVDVRRPR